MRKVVGYAVWGVLALVVGILGAWLVGSRQFQIQSEDILAGYDAEVGYGGLTIRYPVDETLFPPEIVAPTFRWEDGNGESNTWLVMVAFQRNQERITSCVDIAQWTPSDEQWETIKQRSRGTKATVTILGVNRRRPSQILSGGSVSISTSQDEVGAPLFYREVNLPFVEAVKDPSRIRWRFGAISSPRPAVVLQNMPVCGNCHSFSANGETMAMDVDYANIKGSYVITPVAEEMTLATSNIITWNDYRKEDGELTFGLLSQISPDGRFVVSTVKDKSVFVPKPGLEFSQLFFPIKGTLCIFNRDTKTFQKLPGADDPRYVQSNPTWSPDGKQIIFARTEAYDLKHTLGKGKLLLTQEECAEFVKDGKPFRFDLYRVPFNDGQGGEAEPIKGASHNGVSNFFARYSPDGKWIVFCKAKNYMLLQPDSELHIVPAEGGEARRLRCNTHLMNSWHSWSPNSRWLVFSSKANSVYTQLFLTHVDDQGRSTPAVLLSHFTDPKRAANIPEFVNASPSAIRKISERFLDDYSYVRAGDEFSKAGDVDNAIKKYQEALKLNPDNFEAHLVLGFLLYNAKKQTEEGMAHYYRARMRSPNDPRIHYEFGTMMVQQKRYGEAVGYLSQALQTMPVDLMDRRYNLADMNHNLGIALCYTNQFEQSAVHLSEAVRLDPGDASHHYELALVLASLGRTGRLEGALSHYAKAVSLDPEIDQWPRLHHVLAVRFAQAGRFREAVSSAERALELTRAREDADFARRIEQELTFYRQNQQPPRPGGPDGGR